MSYKIPTSLTALRVNQDVKPKNIAGWIGVSVSRYYYFERKPLELSLERVVKLSSGYNLPVQDIVHIILTQEDIL